MITNNTITYYHKTLDPTTKLEKWQRRIFSNVWAFAKKSVAENSGISNNNDIQVRIDMKNINDLGIFKVGDIILVGKGNNINTQSELQGLNFFNVTSVTINNFGGTPHVHLGGN